MQRRAQFGRRAAPPAENFSAPVRRVAAVTDVSARDILAASVDDDVEREIKAWNKERKLQRRRLREPWRSVSIVTAIGFGLSSWILPEEVADIAQWVTLGLSVAAFAASLRRPHSETRRSPSGESERRAGEAND